MVATLTPAQPHGTVGPGLPLQLTSTVTPTAPAIWRISVESTPLPGLVAWQEDHPFAPNVQLNLGLGATNQIISPGPTPVSLQTEAPIQVTAQVRDSSQTTVDQIAVPATWDLTSGVPTLQLLTRPTQGSGGFTDSDRALLQQTQQATVPSVQVDDFLTSEITHGPQGGVAAAQLGAWVFAIIVRITGIPPELVAGTPDQDYFFPSLAVIRVFRGTDIWLRVPVHTSSKYLNLANEGIEAAVTSILPVQWLLQMSVQVAFGPGVTGQVFLVGPS